MDTDELSPESSENPAPNNDGDQPQTGAPAETATTESTKTDTGSAVPDSIDEIRALMRENSDALVQSKRDPWTDLTDETENEAPSEETKTEDADKSKTAAQPGEDENADPELTAEEKAAKEEADKKAAEEANQPKSPKKDLNRVRTARFPEEDRLVINRMAEPGKEGLSIDQARAELIAEGKIKKPDATAAPAAKSDTVTDVTAEAVETQKGVIADLEKKIEEAGAAFNTGEMAKLNIQHNKALAELNKLETKAEADRSRAEAETQTRAETARATAIAAAESDAVALFADAGVEGSALFERIEDLMDAAPASAFEDPNYPLVFAAKAARELGIKPAPAQPAAPPIVPKKPSRPAPPPGPASGSSNGAPAPKQQTVEAKAKAALDSNDPEAIRAALREAGTRTLDGE